MRLPVALSVRPSRNACVGPSAPINNRPVPPARFETSGPRDQNGSQRTGGEACHASIGSGRCRYVNMIAVINIPRPSMASSPPHREARRAGRCQRFHQSVDDRLANASRQTIKSSLRIGQTSGAPTNANALKCSMSTFFPISTFGSRCEPKIDREPETWIGQK